MLIALHDADKTRFGNLALMKISAWHKIQGDTVEWYMPLKAHTYDKVYSSKIFTFTQSQALIGNVQYGGTGYNLNSKLPDYIEHIMPDYSLYGHNVSRGFLTRGCIRSCGWCVVPKKEGKIYAHADIEEFLAHKQVVLMDNNIIAHDHGITQLEKISRLGVKIDINQGVDARLIDDGIAKLFGKIKWLNPVRLACDTISQMPHIEKAVHLMRQNNVTPKRYFCYVLVKDSDDALERVEFLRKLNVNPFAQPYRDFENDTEPTQEQKAFARWVNMKACFKTCSWYEYKYK